MANVEEDDNEIRFARKLAANDNKKRRMAVKGLKAWLKVRSEKSPNGVIEELEMRKLWRGLFFCMWLADKAPVQNELAMNIAELVHCFDNVNGVRSWILVCGQTMRGEWGRLDKYRIDKFYTMLRHIVHEALVWAQNNKWNAERVQDVAAAIHDGFIVHSHPSGIRFHIVDVLPDEMFSFKDIQGEAVMQLLNPLLNTLAVADDKHFFKRSIDNLLMKLPDHIQNCPQVSLEALHARIFELASSPDTRDRYRQELYNICRLLQAADSNKTMPTTKTSSQESKQNKRKVPKEEEETKATEEDTSKKVKKSAKKAKKEKQMEEEPAAVEPVSEVKKSAKKAKKEKQMEEEPAAVEPVSEVKKSAKKAKKEKQMEEEPAAVEPVSEVKKSAKKAKKEKQMEEEEATTSSSQVARGAPPSAKKVRFGQNKYKDHNDSVQSLRDATPPMGLASPAKGILSATKKPRPATTPLSAKKSNTPKSAKRNKATDFY